MAEIVVVGAGVAGLGTALAASERGHHVVVLERDAGALPETADEFFTLGRRGAPQVRHSHAFLARLRDLLRDRAPAVLDALLAEGAVELRFTDNLPPTMEGFVPEPGDEDLVALACRRTTFEWVLRRVVGGHDGVEIRSGVNVQGLRAAGGRIDGVRTPAGDVRADLVVDATGPRGPLARWLREAAGVVIPEEEFDCDLVYSSRFYRLPDGVAMPTPDGPIGADLGYLKYAVFPGDNRTFSITYAVPPEDTDLRALLHEGPFEAAAARMPATEPWTAGGAATALTAVQVHAGLRNRWRTWVDGARPLVLGVVPVGDASSCTNPLYGRGCSLAFVHAFALADALDALPDVDATAGRFWAATQQELRPWFEASVDQDRRDRLQRAGAGPGEDPIGELLRDGLFPATRTDPVVFRAFLRTFNLLDPPDAMLRDADVAARVLAAFQDREARPPQPLLGPERAELLDVIAEAVP